jgi:ATP-binding cassette, subfamily B, bacterial
MPIKDKINALPRLSKNAWLFYLSFFKAHYKGIFWTTIAAAAQTLVIIPSLLLVKFAFDHVIPQHNVRMLVLIGVAIFVLRLINSLISLSLRRRQIRIINHGIYQLRENLLHKIYNFSWLFYANSDLRVWHTRIVQDTERLANMTTAIISRLLPSTIIGLGLLAVCFMLNWYLLLIVISLFPLLIIANRLMAKRIKKRVFKFQRAFEEFSKGMFFVLRYLPLTTIQSAQKEETEKQKSILKDLQHKSNRMADIYSGNLQLQETLIGVTAIVVIIVGGISVAVDRMTLGDFLSFYLAAMYLNKYVNTITTSIPDIIAGNVSLNTIHDLYSSDHVIQLNGEGEMNFDGEVELRGVFFSYGRNQVLQGADLHILPGRSVAIIGANGSGKTTILNLITGLLTPTAGEIAASGHSYSTLDMIQFRKHLGVVAQHPPLFPGSVTDNIVYGSEGVDPDRLKYVCTLALADEFITALPDGYETNIGDDGVLLSGGEGQRIAIARALYRNPKLLILDEPTNHLDADAIGQIMSNLNAISPRPSILIISHQKGVIDFAESIYHLKDGVLTPESPAHIPV